MSSSLKNHSLKRQYSYKLFTNLMGLGLGFVNQLIVPRVLGPSSYGSFSFLTNFFSQFLTFLDGGSSTFFYRNISQNNKDRTLISAYALYSILLLFLCFGSIVAVQIFNQQHRFWPNQKLIYIYLAALFSIVTWYSGIIGQILDAFNQTIYLEKIRIWIRLFGTCLILVFFALNKLNLNNYFLIQIIPLGILILLPLRGIAFHSKIFDNPIKYNDIRKCYNELWAYSHPLLMTSIIGMISGVFDRWFLQQISGDLGQGYFGFAFQIGSLGLVLTSAFTPLLMREFSIAVGKEDPNGLRFIFDKYTPIFLSVTAALCCFVSENSNAMALFFGGDRFNGARASIRVLAFYPLAQTYIQLIGSVFLAKGQTKLYKNITLVTTIIGIPITYILVSGSTTPAGELGLAIKTVGVPFILIHCFFYFVCQTLNLNFKGYVLKQYAVIFYLLFLATLTNNLVEWLFETARPWIHLSINAFVYGGLLIVTLRLCPKIFGVSNDQLRFLLSGISSFKDRKI